MTNEPSQLSPLKQAYLALEKMQAKLEAAAKAMAQVMTENQAVSEASSLIGETIGRFQILSLLGKGGMGRVDRARHIQSGTVAALKQLRFDRKNVENDDEFDRDPDRDGRGSSFLGSMGGSK